MRSTGSCRSLPTSRRSAPSSVRTPPSVGFGRERRLGCTACVEGELVIDVPPESQVHRQVVRKDADAHPIEVDPVVRLHYVEVEQPDLASPSSDLGRLRDALEREWELTGLRVTLTCSPACRRRCGPAAGASPSPCTTAP